VTPVTGRVFLGDEPLTFGTVTFQPASGQPALGQIEPDGRFELTTFSPSDGAMLGRHRIRVSCYASQDPDSDMPAGGDSLGHLLVPQRYASFATSGLDAIVLESGNGPFILRLQPDPPEEELLGDDAEQSDTETDGAAESEQVSEDTNETKTAKERESAEP
jgi:hypothetical protein